MEREMFELLLDKVSENLILPCILLVHVLHKLLSLHKVFGCKTHTQA